MQASAAADQPPRPSKKLILPLGMELIAVALLLALGSSVYNMLVHYAVSPSVVVPAMIVIALLARHWVGVDGLTAWTGAYLLGLLAWGRAFAYVQIGPVYITEAYLAVACVLTVGRLLTDSVLRWPTAFYPWLALVLFTGLKVLTAGEINLLVLRHSVIGFYSVFYIIGWFLAKEERSLRFLLAVGMLGAIVNLGPLVSALVTNTTSEGMRLYGGNHVTPVYACLALMVWWGRKSASWSGREINKRADVLWMARLRPHMRFLLMVAFCYQILVSYHRSSWLGLLIAGALVVAYDYISSSCNLRLTSLKYARLLVGLIIPALLLYLTAQYLAGQPIHRPSDRPSAFTEYVVHKANIFEEPNATWRWGAWQQAIQRFQENPLMGMPMADTVLGSYHRGVPSFDPHNSYLAILARFGVVGTLVFLLFWGTAAFSVARDLIGARRTEDDKRYALYFFVAHIFTAVFAAFNVVLEGPHHGSFFWLSLGLAAGAVAARAKGHTGVPAGSALQLAGGH